MTKPNRISKPQSALSVVMVLAILVGMAEVHNNWKGNAVGEGQQRNRLLKEFSENIDSIDDDGTRDSVCQGYIMNFLNGTTDVKDECSGMLNAYQDADCADDTNVLHPMDHHKRKQKRNHTVFDDDANANDEPDVMIDDYVEVFQCCYNINQYYSKHCQQEQLASMRLFGITGVLVLCGLLKSLIRIFKVEWIPDAAACILLGAIVGGIIKLFSDQYVKNNLSFDNNLFLNILLPPIIFSSALSIDKRAFRRDLFPILMFAIVGTIFSAVMIGYISNSLTSLPMLESLLFGALISSIDPVATLSILSGIGIKETDTLYTLIFGEALLNDGAAVVLFDTLLHQLAHRQSSGMVWKVLISFIQCSIGAIAIGVGCGIVCTVYFWALRGRHTPVVETAIFFCFALMPFYVSDGAGMSGIISIMTMGFFLDYFVVGGSQSDDARWMAYIRSQTESFGDSAHHSLNNAVRAFSGTGHLSEESKHHVVFVAEVIASLMETAIFAYLGLFLFNDKYFWNIGLKSAAVFGCVISRAAMIILLSAIINLFVWLDVERRLFSLCCPNEVTDDDSDSAGSNNKSYLDRRTQQVLLLAGVRGAVSFALVENIPLYDAVRMRGSTFKPELKSMTAASILVTVFVFGPLTYYLVKKDKEEGHFAASMEERLLDHDDQIGEFRNPGLISANDLELSETPPPSDRS